MGIDNIYEIYDNINEEQRKSKSKEWCPCQG